MAQAAPVEQPLDVAAAGQRIDALLTASASGGVVARERAEELVRTTADLYGAGLERLLDLLHELGRLDDAVLDRLAADHLISSLLLVHGLHPYDVRTRVERALDSVRPYLGSHGGDVELLDVGDDGVVRLRLLGSCDGCPSSSATLSLAVEGAIEAAAPEITSIEVLPAEDAPKTLISPGSLRARIAEPDAAPASVLGATWLAVPAFERLAAGEVVTSVVGGLAVIGCRVGADAYAFRAHCPACAGPLDGASVARRLGGAVGDAVLVCPACRAHYDVRHAGAGLDDPALHLDPLPLLAAGAGISVAVPTPVATPVPT